MKEKTPTEILQEISKTTLAKWTLFLIITYALYDAVYIFANSRQLLLALNNVTSGMVPILALHMDLPLFLGSVIICVLFDRRRMISALAVSGVGQLVWMALGVTFFLVCIFVIKPSGLVALYKIIQALLVFGLAEELIFRGLLFSWLDSAGCGKFAYLLSGLAWGAHYGIRAVVTGTTAIWAVLPVALFGVVIGGVAAFIYKKTDSLWLVVYVHGALCLL